MSKIPKPKTMPSPKSVGGDKDLASTRHDELLHWLWSNADKIMATWVSREKWASQAKQSAIEAYKTDQIELANEIENYAKTYTAQADKLNAVAELFKKHAESMSPPKFPVGDLVTTLLGKDFQYELTEEKANRSGGYRTEIIGYVDMRAEIKFAFEISLSSAATIPHKALICWTDNETNGGEAARKESVENKFIAALCALKPKSPKWSVIKKSYQVCFDVRAELPSTGVLIRELKTLRNIIDDDDSPVALVSEGVAKELRDILQAEGFMVLDRLLFRL